MPTTRTITMATVTDDDPELYLVVHRSEVDPVAALRAAAREFLATPAGLVYYVAHVYPDIFNIGDALLGIPRTTLRRHGVSQVDLYSSDRVVQVCQDEPLAELPAGDLAALVADWREAQAE